MPDQRGLEWISTTFGLEPRWTEEPNLDTIAQIAREHLHHDGESPVKITFHAQGAFNKLYKISTSSSDSLLRVSLPVDPHLKTKSEVATIEFVRKATDMPVPRIIAFNSDNQNELGFEWILMEMMPGVALRKKWRTLTWEAKEDIVKQMAFFQAQLFLCRFRGIGNLFPAEGQGNESSRASSISSESFILGQIVSLVFFWGDHLKHSVPRGPFEASREWLHARLEFVLADQELILKTSDDEDDIEDAEFAKDLATRILQVLPQVFQPDTAGYEESILFHDDLHMENILVDEEGTLTAIIDWECVSVLPLWRACQLPRLVEGRTREAKPKKTEYTPDLSYETQESTLPGALDNEGVDTLYWDHLLEYEQTQLRKLFLDEMKRLSSDWISIFETNTLRSDFEKAVHNCDNSWCFKIVNRWLNAYKDGNLESLAAMLIE